MKSVHSIEKIKKIIHTGSKPVLIMCDDEKDYYCKYQRHIVLREYLGHCFAQEWGIITPEAAWVNIAKEHIEQVHLAPPVRRIEHFDRAIFGSLQVPNATEIDDSWSYLKSNNNEWPQELLKIMLFDYWLSNEDRNANNANPRSEKTSKQAIGLYLLRLTTKKYSMLAKKKALE